MRLDRRIELILVVVAWIVAGCTAGSGGEAPSTPTLDYVSAVRPLAYDNAYAACSGHSLTSLAYEFDVSAATVAAAARNWAQRTQRDARMRHAAYRGCRDALWKSAGAASH